MIMKWQAVGNSLMIVGVLGLVGWIGYENVRVQSSREYADEQEAGGNGPQDGDADPLPETHELLMVEMTLPDVPDLAAAPVSHLRIQFSTTEWNKLKQQAEESNVPVIRYVREKLLDLGNPVSS